MSWDIDVSQETDIDFTQAGTDEHKASTEEHKAEILAEPSGTPAPDKTIGPSASLGVGVAGWDIVPRHWNPVRSVEIWAPGGYGSKEDEGRQRGLKRWVKGVLRYREG
jgi:hypothetical protein